MWEVGKSIKVIIVIFGANCHPEMMRKGLAEKTHVCQDVVFMSSLCHLPLRTQQTNSDLIVPAFHIN